MKVQSKSETELIVTDPRLGAYIGGAMVMLLGVIYSIFFFLCRGEIRGGSFRNLSALIAVVCLVFGATFMTRRRFVFYKGIRRCDWTIYYFGFLKSRGSNSVSDLDIIERDIPPVAAYRIELRNSDQVGNRYPWLKRVISIDAWRKGIAIGALGKVDNDRVRAIAIAREIAEFSGIRAWDWRGNIIYSPQTK